MKDNKLKTVQKLTTANLNNVMGKEPSVSDSTENIRLESLSNPDKKSASIKVNID